MTTGTNSRSIRESSRAECPSKPDAGAHESPKGSVGISTDVEHVGVLPRQRGIKL